MQRCYTALIFLLVLDQNVHCAAATARRQVLTVLELLSQSISAL
jgi:hypothetical protein